ncbi:Hypothetical predicted protein [Podarcis lilfordi]|uniref:Uncharacterized protein n=1 Tax=Podarcis lilfordi TaxID=74358 RepID=A0AA35K6K9_9SAUR|nr:Hypothetical predicted protein [Podarcis lilfordi]
MIDTRYKAYSEQERLSIRGGHPRAPEDAKTTICLDTVRKFGFRWTLVIIVVEVIFITLR